MTIEKFVELVAWPSALLLLGGFFLVLFRKSINLKIRGLVRAGAGDKVAVFNDPEKAAADQKVTLEATKPLPPAPPTHDAPPPASEVVAKIETEIAAALAQSNTTPEVKNAWLIRALATTRLWRAHEISYRLVLGSQLQFFLEANTPGGATESRAHEIYDAAATAFPNIYKTFSFETWSHWPVNFGLLIIERPNTNTTIFRTTGIGKDFLHYLIDNNLTSVKAG